MKGKEENCGKDIFELRWKNEKEEEKRKYRKIFN